MAKTPTQEDKDAGKTRNHRTDGRPDASDASVGRSSSRRQTSPGETSRDEDQGDYHAEKEEDIAPEACVTRSHTYEYAGGGTKEGKSRGET